MRKYNFIRPLWIIAIALITRMLVTNLCLLVGSSPESADTIGFLAMIIAAFITFRSLNKRRRNSNKE